MMNCVLPWLYLQIIIRKYIQPHHLTHWIVCHQRYVDEMSFWIGCQKETQIYSKKIGYWIALHRSHSLCFFLLFVETKWIAPQRKKLTKKFAKIKKQPQTFPQTWFLHLIFSLPIFFKFSFRYVHSFQ